MRALAFVAVVATHGACAVTSPIAADHPASPQAPIGELAGAPAALRPGVVVYPDLPRLRAPDAEPHHHHP